MTTPWQPNPAVRISDQERSDAMSALGSHFAQGRLELVEYEDRVAAATCARSRQELDQLFHDLPPLSAGAQLMPYYSAAEVEKAHRDGAKPKLGIFLLSVLGGLAGCIVTSEISGILSTLCLFIPAVVFVLLYVMKVGPDHWHAPSNAELERRRLAAIKAEQKFHREQHKIARRQKTQAIQQSLLGYAQNKLTRGH